MDTVGDAGSLITVKFWDVLAGVIMKVSLRGILVGDECGERIGEELATLDLLGDEV